MTQPCPTTTPLHRRTLVRGAAWTSPMVVVTGTAPAFAASPTPALGGALTFNRSSTTDSCRITLGGNGPSVFNSQGFWIADATTTTAATRLTMIVYLPSTWAGATVARGSGGATTWSFLRPLSTITNPPDGMPSSFVAYTTTYSGALTYDAANKALLSLERPFLTLTRAGACASTLTMYVRRTALVDGQTQTVDRNRVL